MSLTADKQVIHEGRRTLSLTCLCVDLDTSPVKCLKTDVVCPQFVAAVLVEEGPVYSGTLCSEATGPNTIINISRLGTGPSFGFSFKNIK